MGVPRLTTFVDSNKQLLLADYSLHDCRVIIDGNNVYHFLYYHYRVRHECAGDYDVFSTCCHAFFTTLHQCDITPYVVFDGAHHEDKRKFKTSLNRASERIHLAGFLSVGNRAKILPILAFEAFRDILNELGVAHVTCYSEADEQIAALSRRWRCPVLTNDSDFYVYDLPGGVIPLDYIDLTVKHETCVKNNSQSVTKIHYYLSVQLYQLDNLIGFFKLPERPMVALAATLLGNDVVNKQQFEAFYARMVLKTSNSKLKVVTISNIFEWLASTSTVTNAISRVINCFDSTKQGAVKLLINKSIESYTNPSCDIEEHFLSVKTAAVLGNPVPPLSFNGRSLPAWFLACICNGSIPVRALSAVTQRRVILLSQIETMNEPSAYECSQRLRCVFYSILLTVDVSNDELNETFVKEHDRELKVLKCKTLGTLKQIAAGIPVPQLGDIPNLCFERRLEILYAALSPSSSRLKSSVLREFPVSVQVFILTIMYWVLHAKPKVSKVHAKALVVGAICLGALDDFITGKLSLDGVETVGNDSGDALLPSKDCDTAILEGASCDHTAIADRTNEVLGPVLQRIKTSLLQRLSSAPRINNASVFDGKTVHAFSQYQTCLQGTIYLKQILLLSSITTVHPSRLFNGTLLYNLVQELESRVNPDLYIEQLLERDSIVAAQFNKIIDAVSTLLPSDCLKSVKPCSMGVKRSKRNRLRKEREQVEKDEDCLASNDDQPQNDSDNDDLIDIDANNKFSSLTILSTDD